MKTHDPAGLSWGSQPFRAPGLGPGTTNIRVQETNKKHLNSLARTLTMKNEYKRVRVINLNPSTLENNKIFDDSYNKLKFTNLLDTINFIINLPQEVEISDLTIRSTQKRNQSLM